MNLNEMPAGRELDALVAEKVMGLPSRKLGEACPKCNGETRIGMERAWCFNCHEWIYSPYPEYSTDIAAAWMIIEKVNGLGDWSIWQSGNGSWHATISFDQDLISDEIADTAPLTVCRAALKAIQNTEKPR